MVSDLMQGVNQVSVCALVHLVTDHLLGGTLQLLSCEGVGHLVVEKIQCRDNVDHLILPCNPL